MRTPCSSGSNNTDYGRASQQGMKSCYCYFFNFQTSFLFPSCFSRWPSKQDFCSFHGHIWKQTLTHWIASSKQPPHTHTHTHTRNVYATSLAANIACTPRNLNIRLLTWLSYVDKFVPLTGTLNKALARQRIGEVNSLAATFTELFSSKVLYVRQMTSAIQEAAPTSQSRTPQAQI